MLRRHALAGGGSLDGDRRSGGDDRKLGVERASEPRKGVLGRVARAALDPADLGLVEAGELGDLGLGQATAVAEHGELGTDAEAVRHLLELGQGLRPLGSGLSPKLPPEVLEGRLRPLLHAPRLWVIAHTCQELPLPVLPKALPGQRDLLILPTTTGVHGLVVAAEQQEQLLAVRVDEHA